MSIETTDILLKLATDTGPGDSTAGSPNSSLGGFISTTEIVSATLHNLFAIVSGAENAAEVSKYRCFFIHNANAVDTFLNVAVFIQSEVSGGADIAIGVDPTVASALDSATAQAVDVADEDTAPAGVSFSAPTEFGSALSVGDLEPGEVRAIWVRRTTTNSPAQSNDGATIRVQGETL